MLAFAIAFAALQSFRVEPRTASHDEMTREVFDPRWIVPSGLPLAEEGGGVAWELEVELEKRIAFVAEASSVDASAPRSFGDVVKLARGADAKAIEALLERVESAQPRLWKEIAPFAKELLRDEGLRASKWNPDKDAGNDGLFLARPLSLAESRVEPWSKIEGSRLVQQGAVLVYADLDALKAAENDFTAYRKRPGATYEAIYPVEGSYVRGLDPDGRAFAASKLFFESDLPFPFGTYSCDLRIQNRLRADGRLVCDIASTSADFYWMAGRDLFLPVRASDGAWQGTLVVRLFGFDLRGVPDGDDARRAGLRSSLGSLKRESEALFAKLGVEPRTIDGAVPEYEVRGTR